MLDLSRNFGKEIALTAGLHHARGEAVVVIDADLQDPPELIPRLVAPWREQRRRRRLRAADGPGRRGLRSSAAPRGCSTVLMQHVGRIHIPPDTGDFRLLSRRAVDALREYPEQHRFMKGLFTWIGFDQVAVPYERDPRLAGASKWSWLKLVNLAIEGITSFTAAPLALRQRARPDHRRRRVPRRALHRLQDAVRYGDAVAGYPSLMTAVLFLGGVQLTAIGILGEYLGRVFNETKRRPLYHVKDYRPPRRACGTAGRACRCGVTAAARLAPPRPWSASLLQYGRFALVGLGATLVHVLVYAGVDRAAGIWRRWRPTRSASRRRERLVPRSPPLDLPRRPAAARRAASRASGSWRWLGFALNSLFVQLVTGTLGLPYGWAIPLIAGVTPVVTFTLSKLWAFRG